MLTGYVNIRNAGDSRRSDVPAVHDDPTGRILDAHQHFSWVPAGPADGEDIVVRWAKIFHGLHLEYDSEHGGYWFVAGADAKTATTPIDTYSRALFYDNFPELKPGTPEHLAKQAEIIEQEQETYRQWAEGEVDGVILQRRRELYRLDDDGVAFDEPSLVDWEDGDSLWGIFGLNENGYTPQVVALEHFELTEEEEAAARA